MNMDRRKFLSQSLAASAGLAGLPSLAGGRPSKEKYRVGIIGCGRMGQYFAEVYRAPLPDTESTNWSPLPSGIRNGARLWENASESRRSLKMSTPC